MCINLVQYSLMWRGGVSGFHLQHTSVILHENGIVGGDTGPSERHCSATMTLSEKSSLPWIFSWAAERPQKKMKTIII